MNAPATPSRGLPIWIGVGVAMAALILRDSIAVSPGEPAWLRWLRVLADHPIRAGLAASLLLLALSPTKPDVEETGEPPSS